MPARTGTETGGGPQPLSLPASVFKRARKAIDDLRGNPKGDWEIADLERISNQIGLIFSPPTRGSHYKVTSPRLVGSLVVPAHKPIKPPYIREFVSLCEAHLQGCTMEQDHG